MEGDNKVHGFGKFLLFWLAGFLALVIVLACLGCSPGEPLKADSGAICMTPEALQFQLNEAYANGYAKAMAENPAAGDVVLNRFTKERLIAFLKWDQCDRCLSSVESEDTSEACLDRASCLMASARNEGVDVYGVVMNFKEDGAHAIVAFPLKDGSLVYVEPWLDMIVTKVNVGDNYLSNFPGMTKKQIIEKIVLLK
jgi:hypothetical protein